MESAATWFFVCSLLTYFAAKITALMYVASVCDASFAYFINIVICYDSAVFFVYTFWNTYLYTSFLPFYALLLSPWYDLIHSNQTQPDPIALIYPLDSAILALISSSVFSMIRLLKYNILSDTIHSDMFTQIWSNIIQNNPI